MTEETHILIKITDGCTADTTLTMIIKHPTNDEDKTPEITNNLQDLNPDHDLTLETE